ncbi:3-beta hydroxysteroid dehydrogenase [Candidatus Marinamargulisbacteria bacterium SCGC AAA071-K20]|nr:3-beta hydroxysteroid dehydrogenase [Candidatus Marinamargulisbacteria bacterium SCGC AAA071-K20]
MTKPLQVLLTGATGFTGSYVLKELLNQPNLKVTLFVRDLQKADKLGYTKLPIKLHKGCLEDTASIKQALYQKDILINIASLGFGHAPVLIDACPDTLKKAIFISTTGIFTKLNPDSKQIRLDAEKAIQNSALNFTIIRPTMIFGSAGDRNMSRLIQLQKKLPFFPVFGSGNFLQQPIYVEDLSRFIVQASLSEKSNRKTYNLAGLKAISFNDIIDTISKQLKKNVFKLHIPYSLSLLLAYIYECLFKAPKIKVEQIKRLNEHKNFSIEAAKNDFNFTPLDFESAIKKEIESLT